MRHASVSWQTFSRSPGPPVPPPLSVYKTLTHFVSFGKNCTPFLAIRRVLMFKTVFKIVIFQKIVDAEETLQKSQKCHEKSIRARQLSRNINFQRRNDFDHTHDAIRGGSWKNVIFDAKIVEIAQNHRSGAFSLKIVDFSASGTNRPFHVVGSVPGLKIIIENAFFCMFWTNRGNN